MTTMASVKFSKSGGSFISYINFEAKKEPVLPPLPDDMPGNGLDDCCKPRISPKEVVLHTVERVLKFSTFGELNSGVPGALYCTNSKLSFVPMKNLAELLDDGKDESWPLGAFDISLTNIESVEQITAGKRKKIAPSAGVASPADMIQIFCKDFRVFSFSFRFSPAEDVIKALDYLGRHPFVNSIELLFGFAEESQSTSQTESINENYLAPYDSQSEWETELKRCGVLERFRVTDFNERFVFSGGLPRRFVIPKKMTDHKLDVESKHYKDNRIFSWSYSLGTVHLLRGSLPDTSTTKEGRQSSLLECQRSDTEEFDIELSCPGLREVHQSYLRLMALCTPTNVQEFDEMDSHFLSRMEETRWLTNVSLCLKEALKVASTVQSQKKFYVIVREKTGVDMCCVICSLVQVILDPYSRTRKGFENLVRKEWIAMGHPFAERLSHIRGMNASNVQLEAAPMYLMFLDCVWQLLDQFPECFEFSETYLSRMWDHSLVGLYDAFVFNNNKERTRAARNGSTYRRLFDWSEWLSAQDLELLKNPFYLLNDNRSTDLLLADHTVKCLNIWTQCYFRWIPKSEVVNGDPAMLFTFYLRVAKDIELLQRQLQTMQATESDVVLRTKRMPSDEFLASSKRTSRLLKPGSDLKMNVITSSFPFAPPGPIDWGSFHGSCQTSQMSGILGDIQEERNTD